MGDAHTATLSSLINLALVPLKTGEAMSAEAMLREAVDVSRSSVGAAHAQTLACLTHLGTLLEGKGTLEEALTLHTEVLDVYAAAGNDGTRKLASHVAALLQRVGRGAVAEEVLKKHGVV